MVRIVVAASAVVLGVAASYAAMIVIGLRTKSRPILTAVRRINRKVWNPRAMRTAGRPGASASIVRHVGRTSGRTYETPVVALASDDGFVIALPYGDQADWYRNVMARGSATIVHDGSEHEVGAPEVIAMGDAVPPFTDRQARNHLRGGVDRCLRLRSVPARDGET